MKWRSAWPLLLAFFSTLIFVKFCFFNARSSDIKLPASHLAHALTKSDSTTPSLASSSSPRAFSIPDSSEHPIRRLQQSGLQSFERLIQSQSKTLQQATQEYRRRYGTAPPPLFNKWYEFARRKGVMLIDEFDAIHDSLLPFWAMQPVSIRSRVQEALGYEPNGLIALQVRDGKVARLEGGPEWQMPVMKDMIHEFVHLLPDMDLAFNLHDEPRIVIPHDELSEMVRIGRQKAHATAESSHELQNSFSSRPADVNDGKRRFALALSSRFNEYQHQPVWVPSRLSCSPSSRARDFRDNVEDDVAGFAFGDLAFVYNQTAFSDICSTPSLRDTYGFFRRANAFKVSHELIPIFSQSKLSSFQDILYPSPWYYYGKTVTDQPIETHKAQYNESLDEPWDGKSKTLWWRGSTTGGFSREGGWRRQHRQIFVSNINAATDTAQILSNHGSPSTPNWQAQQVPRANYSHLIDVHFSGVGQCDPGDCDAEREYFDLAPPVDPQEAWKHRFLLDMDGNAFSGRFYSFLRSKSLPFKLSIFREWHQDWLVPWVHYVPLSLRGEEHLEAVRYLATEGEGLESAAKMAIQGREWAGQVLRNQDLEVWFFRLLLEYARIIDDKRERIGFTL